MITSLKIYHSFTTKITFKLEMFIFIFLVTWYQQWQQKFLNIFVVQNLIHTLKHICGYFPGFWWDFVHLEIAQCWHVSWLGFFGNICNLHAIIASIMLLILSKLETWEYFEEWILKHPSVWQWHNSVTLAWGTQFKLNHLSFEEHTPCSHPFLW